jgi:hypothetical protein
VLAGTQQNLMRIDAATGNVAWTVALSLPADMMSQSFAVAFSADGLRAFVVVGPIGMLEVDLPSGNVRKTYFMLPSSPMLGHLAASADGKKVAIMRHDLNIVDLTQSQPFAKRIFEGTSVCTGFSMTPDARVAVALMSRISSSAVTTDLHVIDIEKESVDTIGLDEAWGVAMLPGGRLALIACKEGLKVLDLSRKTVSNLGLVHGRTVAVSPSGCAVVAGHSGVFLL